MKTSSRATATRSTSFRRRAFTDLWFDPSTGTSSSPSRVRLPQTVGVSVGLGERGFVVDPITFSVVLNRFDSIAKEMTLTLEFTAWTSILALAKDFSCAIYDRDARQVTMSEALPMHMSSLSIVLKEIARTFEGDIGEGDVIACNDPYRGNTHIGDLVTACPVFWEGELLFWAVTKGHQLDCGAFIASSVTPSSKNVWQEGITIPPVKLYEAGVQRAGSG